jgi:hypothetical protein
MKKRLLQGVFLTLATTLVGCGQKELPVQKTYPVQGRVTLKGEPVAFAIVHLEPKDQKNPPALAYTDKDGIFNGARSYSNSEMDGAAPGEYEVKLEGLDLTSSPKFFGPRPGEGEKPTPIPPEVANTGLTVTIEANDDNQLNIEIN